MSKSKQNIYDEGRYGFTLLCYDIVFVRLYLFLFCHE